MSHGLISRRIGDRIVPGSTFVIMQLRSDRLVIDAIGEHDLDELVMLR